MDKKLMSLIGIFMLSFGVFFSVIVFNKPLSRLIRASQETNPSAANSLIFAWPLTVKADGQTPSTITVFLRNEKNYPVPNKPVTVLTSFGEIKESQVVSSKDGKTEFHITSATAGIANITVQSGTLTLTQKMSVKFE